MIFRGLTNHDFIRNILVKKIIIKNKRLTTNKLMKDERDLSTVQIVFDTLKLLLPLEANNNFNENYQITN